METKESKKSVVIAVVITVLVIVILIMGYFMYQMYTGKNTNQNIQISQNNNLENTIEKSSDNDEDKLQSLSTDSGIVSLLYNYILKSDTTR